MLAKIGKRAGKQLLIHVGDHVHISMRIFGTFGNFIPVIRNTEAEAVEWLDVNRGSH